MSKKIDSTVEALLKERNVASSDVKEALEMYQAQKKKENQNRILERLASIDQEMEVIVDNLRLVRKLEASIKKDLVHMNERKAAYLQNPSDENFEQFIAECAGAKRKQNRALSF